MTDTLNTILSSFLKRKQRVLICCPDNAELTGQIAGAVEAFGGIPVSWQGDYSWNALLRHAFVYKERVIAGPGQLLLGLAKLSAKRTTPLYFRHAIITDSAPQWMEQAITRGLDCRCFRLYEAEVDRDEPDELHRLHQELLQWSSILDCRAVRTSYGLELQAIVFPGKKLPQLPSCAKLNLEPFQPDHIPLYLHYNLIHIANIAQKH